MVAKGQKDSLEVYGNDYGTFDGTGVRDYVHVSDIVLPHILALEKMDGKPGFEIYNIGTGKGFSVLEVVNCASEIINKIIPMQVAPRRLGDAPITVADNAKLLHNLGYELKFSSLENMLGTSWEVLKDI
jgi:UDP-glucose 4-epimerase